jgi:hypothetical protein
MHREDRGGRVISPSSSPSSEDIDSVGDSTPAPSPPDGRHSGLVFPLCGRIFSLEAQFISCLAAFLG